MSILKLAAPCKDYIWGGERLRREFGKSSSADKIAESWELCCRADGQNVIENGGLAGKTLADLIEANGKAAVLGTESARFDDFPIFIKLIENALDVTRRVPLRSSLNVQEKTEKLAGGIVTLLRSCECFTVKKLELDGVVSLEADKRSFHSLLILDGEAEIRDASGGARAAKKGDSVFVTAGTGKYEISGKGLIIIMNI